MKIELLFYRLLCGNHSLSSGVWWFSMPHHPYCYCLFIALFDSISLVHYERSYIFMPKKWREEFLPSFNDYPSDYIKIYFNANFLLFTLLVIIFLIFLFYIAFKNMGEKIFIFPRMSYLWWEEKYKFGSESLKRQYYIL